MSPLRTLPFRGTVAPATRPLPAECDVTVQNLVGSRDLNESFGVDALHRLSLTGEPVRMSGQRLSTVGSLDLIRLDGADGSQSCRVLGRKEQAKGRQNIRRLKVAVRFHEKISQGSEFTYDLAWNFSLSRTGAPSSYHPSGLQVQRRVKAKALP